MNSKRRWFWPVQIVAWLVIGLVNFLPQHFVAGKAQFIQYFNFVAITTGGFIVTSAYRMYLKRRNYRFTLKPLPVLGSLIISSLIMSVGWMVLLVLASLPIAGKYHLNLFLITLQIIPLGSLILIWNLVYLGYYLMRQYHRTEVEKWKLEAEIQKASLGKLKSQINPHFLFNALNNIRALILENPEKARQMLTLFSENFRYALQHSEDSETTVAREIAIVTQYLQLVGIQYEERMQYTVQADETILNEKIPPMILQLLVENAVKHGIALSPSGGIIYIDIRPVGKQLVLRVKNTGTLQEKNQLEDSIGIGLNNVVKRLKLLYNDRAQLKITEEAPFVTVTISIEQL